MENIIACQLLEYYYGSFCQGRLNHLTERPSIRSIKFQIFKILKRFLTKISHCISRFSKIIRDKNEVFHYGFLQEMWPNPQETADLVTFSEEIRNGELHFFVQCIAHVSAYPLSRIINLLVAILSVFAKECKIAKLEPLF